MDTLVLNAAYQPLRIDVWRDVFTKMYSEKADDRVEIVSVYPNRFVRSANHEHPMPSVVRHVKFTSRHSKNIRFGRPTIWARDKGRCQYCGIQVAFNTKEFTFDHVWPRSRGGKTTFTNIVTACKPCNSRKQNKTVEQAGMRLLSIPVRPTSLPDGYRRTLKWKKGMPEEWKIWFNGEYWHGDVEESHE